MQTDKIIKELENIITNGLEQVVIPYKKGKSIRMKNYIIRESTQGYRIFDCTENKPVAKTYFKTSAVAIVKNLIAGNDITKETLYLDMQLLKHYNDAIYFKNTIKTSNNRVLIESRKARLDISLDKTRFIKEKLDNFIFQ